MLMQLLFFILLAFANSEEYSLTYIATTRSSIPSFEAAVSAGRIAAKAINERVFPAIDLRSNITLDMRYNSGVVSEAITDCIAASQDGHTFSVGYNSAAVAVAAGHIGTVYRMTQLTDSSTSLISDRLIYPYFARVNANSAQNAKAITASISYYGRLEQGWDKVAIIAKPDQFSIDGAVSLINTLTENQIEVSTFQQFLLGATEYDIELREIQNSNARIIVAFVSFEWSFLLEEAEKFSLIGDNYVWYAFGTVVAIPFTPTERSRGAIGLRVYIPEDTPELRQFEELWYSADPAEFPNSGGDYNFYQGLAYDEMLVAGYTISAMEQQGILHEEISAEKWHEEVLKVEFRGVTGEVSFDARGDRIVDIEMVYYSPEEGWTQTAIYSPRGESYNVINDVIWKSNSSAVPDLNIQDPFDYWSCHDKNRFRDSTGKSVELHTPDGSDIDDIDIDYHCDAFIDCRNMSDESQDCSSDYVIVFIIFGVVTGLLILLGVIILGFVLLFGCFLGYRKVRMVSTTFLVVIMLSIIVGYSSVYAWFGKPHPVACGFQPWLLGLPALSMIISLSVKNFRTWRIFKFPMKKLQITDSELMIYWCLLMLPALIILVVWTIVSTPTATMRERNGEEHFVCTTGGFTGEPGGIIFFCIFVGYGALILLFGAVISFVSRKVPSEFNESKLLTISIYNLVFLSVIIIPVFLVVKPFNPFIAWILRTTAILYAFTSTMLLQFVPILWNVVISDKLKNPSIKPNEVFT